MTREERRQRRRRNVLMILCWVVVLVWVALLLCEYCYAAWECQLEGVSTGQAITGAAVWAGVLMWVIVRLDTPPKKK